MEGAAMDRLVALLATQGLSYLKQVKYDPTTREQHVVFELNPYVY